MRFDQPVLVAGTVPARARGSQRIGAILLADQLACRVRSRRCLALSLVAHALLLCALFFVPRALPKEPALTEFTLLEPGDFAADAAAPSVAAPSAATRGGAAVAQARDESFVRTATEAEFEPRPQVIDAHADRLASRLATLQRTDASRVVGVAETRLPGTGSAIAPAPAATGGGGTMSLNRGGTTGGGPSLTLTRGQAGGGSVPALATAPKGAERAALAQPEGGGATSARRTLSGASLAGPIADRPVLSYRTPVYPEWAKRDLVGGTVTLYFIVRADGTVKENILVQQTAGFEDFDENARTALRAWKFAPLAAGRTGEQWGTITFRFKLQEAG